MYASTLLTDYALYKGSWPGRGQRECLPWGRHRYASTLLTDYALYKGSWPGRGWQDHWLQPGACGLYLDKWLCKPPMPGRGWQHHWLQPVACGLYLDMWLCKPPKPCKRLYTSCHWCTQPAIPILLCLETAGRLALAGGPPCDWQVHRGFPGSLDTSTSLVLVETL